MIRGECLEQARERINREMGRMSRSLRQAADCSHHFFPSDTRGFMEAFSDSQLG